jgi:hypothetical protein
MRYSFLLVELIFVLCNLVGYSISDAPNFVSGFGLTFLSSTQLNPQLYEVVVSSKQVRGNQTIRILVPTDYTTSGPNRRYPVLYLLHGSSGGAADWTTVGKAQNITSNASLITVMPNGNAFAFYTNWVIPGDDGPQNWATYHMEQLVPWIDLNLRTVAKKEGRAIAGLWGKLSIILSNFCLFLSPPCSYYYYILLFADPSITVRCVVTCLLSSHFSFYKTPPTVINCYY